MCVSRLVFVPMPNHPIASSCTDAAFRWARLITRQDLSRLRNLDERTRGPSSPGPKKRDPN